MRSIALGAVLVCTVAMQAYAQNFTRGDVIVSGFSAPQGFPVSRLQIYGRDGVFKRELLRVDRLLTEPLYRDSVVYVPSRAPFEIERVDAGGNLLTPFATNTVNVNFISPGPAGGLLAVNGSGELYHFAADGTLAHFHNFAYDPPTSGGIDLAADGCTAFYATSGRLVRWDACADTPATAFGPELANSSRALRLLQDGTFLIALLGVFPGLGNRVVHVDSGGNLIRSYPIPADALALDIDGTSFWTNAGEDLVHVDIASGQILGVTATGDEILGLSVVGEPRAGLAAVDPIPALSESMLLALGLALGILAATRLR